jgi:spore coat protein U-like protein
MKRISFIIFALALPSLACAQSKSSSLTQTAQVLSSCSISTVENINFGVVDVLQDTTKTGSGAVRASCTKGSYALSVGYGMNSTFWVWSNAGQGTTYRCRPRAMANAKGATLPYNLYSDSGFAQPISTSDQIMISGGTYVNTRCTLMAGWKNVVFTERQDQTITLYGQMTLDKSSNAGAYTDSLVISLTF